MQRALSASVLQACNSPLLCRLPERAFRLVAIGVLLFGSGPLFAQPVTHPGAPNVIIHPGGSLQIQGSGIGGPFVSPGVSVVQGQLDTNAPAFAYAEFDPPTVAMGGRATYRLVVSVPDGDVRPPGKIPAPPGLSLTPGVSGQQLVLVGGKVWRIWSFNYRARAERVGSVTVPTFAMPFNGNAVNVTEATLQVVAADDPSARKPFEIALDDPQRPLYVGETVPIHINVGGSGTVGLQSVTKLEAGGEGFLVDQNSIYTYQRKTISNQNGRTAASIDTEMLVTPLRAGSLSLTAQAEVAVDPFEGVTALLPGYRPLIESAPLIITATDVPNTGVLSGYNGGIGQFKLEPPPELSTNRVRVGDPVLLTVTLRGEGNVQTIAPPLPVESSNWQLLPPVTDSPVPLPGGMAMQRVFRYTMVPMSGQITGTPAIAFSYFDPSTTRYVDLSIPSQRLTVDSAPSNEVAGASAVVSKSPPVNLPGDAVEEDSRLWPLMDAPGRVAGTLAPWQTRRSFLLLQLIPATLLAGLWLWHRRRSFLEAHPEIRAFRLARRSCRAHLNLARSAAASGDAPGFAAAIVQALRAACAPMTGANPHSLVCGDVLELLSAEQRRGIEGELIRGLFSVVDARQFGNETLRGESLLIHQDEAGALVNQLLDQLQAHVWQCIHRRTNGSGAVAFKPSVAAAGTAGRAGLIGLFLGVAGVVLVTGAAAVLRPEAFQRGIQAYVAGNHDQAAREFREAVKQQPSAGAFHNLGNAEWLRGNTGEAVLAWERAVWVDPFERNSQLNLRFARKAARLDQPQLSWFEACSAWLPSPFWAWTAAGSFWAAGALLILPQVFRRRKTYWQQAGAALGLTLFLLTLPAIAGVQSRARRGVVVIAETPVRLTPTREGEALARLAAGETATISRQRGSYYYIRSVGGVSGWVDADGFQLIAR